MNVVNVMSYQGEILKKKNFGNVKDFLPVRLIKEFPPKNWGKKHWNTFYESCKQPLRLMHSRKQSAMVVLHFR